MKLDRIFAITIMILNRNRVSAEELAEYFEVSVRTIYRDIDTINQAGIPIVAYPGKNGGFGIMDNYRIDRNVLKPAELFSIITALKGVSRTIDDRKINDTVEKLQNLMPKNKADDFEKKRDVIIDFSPWSTSKTQKEKMNTIRNAIDAGKIIEIEYLDAQGNVTKRKIEPMILYLKGYAWYLVAYCLIRDDFRFFKLSRMKSMKITGESFVRRDYREEDTQPGNNWDKRSWIEIEMVFKQRARVRVEDFFEQEQIVYQPDGSIKIIARFPEDEWIYGFMLSFGDDVEILAPQRLRDYLKDKGKKLLEMYR